MVTKQDIIFLCRREKPVYGAVTEEAGEAALDKLDEKWGEQYPIVTKSWRDNWDRLSEFFQYTEPIRRLICTTNTMESYHRQIRKVTKNKGVFPNWGITSEQLAIKFGDRYSLL